MPKFAIITPHDNKVISTYKTKEEAEKKARYSNIFTVIEVPDKESKPQSARKKVLKTIIR